jgi:putative intracellular protease/amidase
MKRFSILAFLALGFLAFLTPDTVAGQEKRVLMILKDGPSLDMEYMLTEEVAVMRSILEGAGFGVVTASPSGQPLGAGGTTLTPDMRLAEVDMADYEGVILPCLAVEEEQSTLEAEALVRAALFSGKPVAAQTGSVVTLARAGLLQGKKFAYVGEWVADVPEFDGMEPSGHGIVRDGKLITSGVCPYAARELGLEDGTQALAGEFISVLWAKS